MKTHTAQHTPGPWEVDADYEDDHQRSIPIVKEGHGYIAGIHILGVEGNVESIVFTKEDRANARLIASAPALLAALKAVDRELKALRLTKMSVETYELVQAAIAQAEGRT